MSYDDELAAHQEHLRIAGTRAGRQYFDPAKVIEEVPEPSPGPPDAGLTHEDCSAAVLELAAEHGTSFSAVTGMADRAHRAAGLGYTVGERARVIAEVAAGLEAGRFNVAQDRLVALSGSLPADCLPPEPEPSSGAGAEVARLTAVHGELLGLAGRATGTRHPSRSGKLVTTRTRAHAEDEDTRDEDQPAEGGKPHRRGLREILADNPELFGAGAGEGTTGNHTYPAKSTAQRENEERRAQSDHRGAFSIQQLGRKVRTGTNTSHPALRVGPVHPS